MQVDLPPGKKHCIVCNCLKSYLYPKKPTMPKYKQAEIFSHYRLYVKDNATVSNLIKPQLWIIQIHGSFELNTHCIQLLINNAIFGGVSFKYITERETHAKTIAKNFEDVSIGRDERYLDDFRKIFHIKSMDDFIDDKVLSQKYKDRYEEIMYTSEEFESCYIFYFWDDGFVKKAKMVCTWEKENRVNKGKFLFFEYDTIIGKWRLPATADSKQDVSVMNQGVNLHVAFTANPPITIVLHSNDMIFNSKPFILCSYTTAFNTKPASGIGLLKKIAFKEAKQQFDDPVPPEIYNLLFQRQSIFRDSEQNYIPGQWDTCYPRQTDFSKGAYGDHLTGVYKGYFLDRNFEGTTAFRIQLMEIDSSGLVRFLNEGNITEGFCSLAADREIIYITSDYKIDIGGIPRVHVLVEMPQKDFELMEGVCSGYTVTNKPYLGQILFQKIKGIATIEEAQKKGYRSNEITYDDQDKPEYKTIFTSKVLKFFYDQRFYSIPYACFQPKYFDDYNKSNKKYNGPTGFFYVYSASTFQWHIIGYPLLIEDSGKVILKDKNQKIHTGTTIIFLKNYLIIDFNNFKNDTDPSRGQFIFFIHDNQIKRFASGISIHITNKLNPEAKREFIIRYPFNDYLKPGKKDNFRNLFEKSENKIFQKNSDDFLELKAHYKQIDTLLGREYNLMVISKDVTKEERVFKREPFEEIYLNEAIYSFIKGIKVNKTPELFPKDIIEKIEHYLTLAMQHGFLEKHRVLHFIEAYCSNVDCSPEQMKESFSTFYEKIFQKMILQASK